MTDFITAFHLPTAVFGAVQIFVFVMGDINS